MADSSHVQSFSSGWFPHSSLCYDRPIIWKMRMLQDTNGCCPTRKTSTIAAWECYVRALHRIDGNIAPIHPGCRMKMLRGKMSWKIDIHTWRCEKKSWVETLVWQDADGWAHVTRMLWAQKTITASDRSDGLRKRVNCDWLLVQVMRWCLHAIWPLPRLTYVRESQVVYWTRSDKCSSCKARRQHCSLSSPVLTTWFSSIVRDHIRDFKPL